MTPGAARTHPRPPEPAAPKPGRFAFIDALRGVAALWVVVYHAHEGGHLGRTAAALPHWALAPFAAGRTGVPIFFVLSGFVIAHSVLNRRVGPAFIGRFALRRAARLDPPYWASIALALGLAYAAHLANPARPYQAPGAGQVLAHLFYVQQILGYPPISLVYWTLALEVQFYLVFCLLTGLAQALRRGDDDRRGLALVFAPALLLAAAWPLGLFRGNLWPGLFPPLWHGFLLGALAYGVKSGKVRAPWFYAYAALIAAGAARSETPFSAACVGTATLLVLASQTGGLERWLRWRWLQALGLISYSLYLVHNPITGALYNLGYRITGRSVATEVFWFAAVLAANIAAAAAAWWLLERPSLALASRVRLTPPEPSREHLERKPLTTSPTPPRPLPRSPIFSLKAPGSP